MAQVYDAYSSVEWQAGWAEDRVVLLVGKSSLDGEAVAEYLSAHFGPVLFWELGRRRQSRLRVVFASYNAARRALNRRTVSINGQTIRVLNANRTSHPTIPTVPIDERSMMSNEWRVDMQTATSLDIQASVIHESFRLKNQAAREELCKTLEDLLNAHLKIEVRVQPFGSSVNGFGWDSSDLDVSLSTLDEGQSGEEECKAKKLFLENSPESKVELLNMVGEKVSNTYHVSYEIIPSKRCPLLEIRLKQPLRMELQVSINNVHAVENTRWLSDLAERHSEWLPKLFSLIRYWFKSCVLNPLPKKKRATSSYCLLLVVITFLQKKRLLQSVNQWKQGRNHALERPVDIGRLFVDFVKYLNDVKFKLRHIVFCPKTGVERSVMQKLEGGFTPFRFNELNVEDPFNESHNPGYTTDHFIVRQLIYAVKMTVASLKKSEEKLPLFTKCMMNGPKRSRYEDKGWVLSRSDNIRRYFFEVKPVMYCALAHSLKGASVGPPRQLLLDQFIRSFALFHSICLFKVYPLSWSESCSKMFLSLLWGDDRLADKKSFQLVCKATAVTWVGRHKIRNNANGECKEGLERELDVSSKLANDRQQTTNVELVELAFNIQLQESDDLVVMVHTIPDKCSTWNDEYGKNMGEMLTKNLWKCCLAFTTPKCREALMESFQKIGFM